MNFSGFDGWIEIFRGGRQKDSQGREHDGDQLINRALAGFDAGFYEPPVVVGHPEHDSPAYGWVKALRKSMQNGILVLEAQLNQVAPEFAEAVREGRFKKRSAAFFDDGRLRHLGFLGGVAPAIAGLKDIAFTKPISAAACEFTAEISPDGAAEQFPHQFLSNGGHRMDVIKDFLSSLKEMGLKLTPAGNIQPGDHPAPNAAGDPASPYQQAELDRKLEAAAAAAREKGKLEGKQEAADEIKAEQEKQAKEHQVQSRKDQITTALDKLVADKKLSPADAAHLKAILLAAEGLTDEEPMIEFAAEPGQPAQKHPAGDWLLHRLHRNTESPLFMELATPDRGITFSTREEERLARKLAGVKEVN